MNIVVCLVSASGLVETFPELALLLQNLELQPLDAILEGLLALPDRARAHLGVSIQARISLARVVIPAADVGAAPLLLPESAGLQVRARLEALNAPLDAGVLVVDALEQGGDGWADFVTQTSLCGGERWLRDELVVANRLKHGGEAGEVSHALAEGVDGVAEEGEAGA